MTTAIAELAATVSLDAREWSEGARQVGMDAKFMGEEFEDLEKRIKDAEEETEGFSIGVRGLSLAIAGVTTALGLVIKRYANYGDTLAKTSRRIGLSVEDLQALDYAANSNQIQFARVEKALQKFGTAFVRLQLRTSIWRTELENLDPVLLQQLETADTVGAGFHLLVKRIRETENNTVKLRLAQTAFGQGPAARMLQVIGQQGTAFENAGEHLKNMNALLDTSETILYEHINQGFANFSTELRGRWGKAVAEFGQEILDLMEAFRTLADFVQGKFLPVMQNFRDAIYKSADSVYFLTALLSFGETWDLINLRINQYSSSILGFGETSEEVAAEVEENFARIQKAVFESLQEQILGPRFEKWRRRLTADPTQIDLNSSTGGGNIGGIEKALLEERAFQQKLLADFWRSEGEQLAAHRKRQEEEAKRLMNAYRFGTKARADRETRLYEKLQEEAEETKKRFDTIEGSIRSGLVDGFLQASSAAEVFASVLIEIQKQLLDMFVAGPIAEGLAQLLHAGYSQLFSSSGGPSPHTPRNPHVPYRAAGGPVDAGRLYRVNERIGSPEFFAPNAGGRVIPLSEMDGAAGGPAVVINIAGVEDEVALRKVGGLVKQEVLAVLPGYIGRLAHQPGGMGTQLRRL